MVIVSVLLFPVMVIVPVLEAVYELLAETVKVTGTVVESPLLPELMVIQLLLLTAVQPGLLQ